MFKRATALNATFFFPAAFGHGNKPVFSSSTGAGHNAGGGQGGQNTNSAQQQNNNNGNEQNNNNNKQNNSFNIEDMWRRNKTTETSQQQNNNNGGKDNNQQGGTTATPEQMRAGLAKYAKETGQTKFNFDFNKLFNPAAGEQPDIQGFGTAIEEWGANLYGLGITHANSLVEAKIDKAVEKAVKEAGLNLQVDKSKTTMYERLPYTAKGGIREMADAALAIQMEKNNGDLNKAITGVDAYFKALKDVVGQTELENNRNGTGQRTGSGTVINNEPNWGKILGMDDEQDAA